MPRSLSFIAAALVAGGSAAAAAFLGPNAPSWATADGSEPAPTGASVHARTNPAGRILVEPDGRIPTLEDALLRLDRLPGVEIRSDDDWNPANGIRGGTGTPEDPYRITGYHVDAILIADTSRCVEISGNWVSRILVLDWTGPCGLVHHNHLENFRTNRNVERTGDPTAAVVTRNEIMRVEELRHFDGTLTENAIGRTPVIRDAPALGDVDLPSRAVVLNIAGLNGADISNNTIHGSVDMKLHGHHHSDAAGAHSHNHGRPGPSRAPSAADGAAGSPPASVAEDEPRREDHATRHVEFLFHDNVVVDRGFGLRYNDLDHAADDRTATSEQEPTLDDPHRHFTTVRIANNVIDGSGLRVSVFNAPDERHLSQSGRLVLEGNTIREPHAGNAVTIQDVQDATVVVSANTVERSGVRVSDGAGVLLQRFANATVLVQGNGLPGFAYGVRAHDFDAPGALRPAATATSGAATTGPAGATGSDRGVAAGAEAPDDQGEAGYPDDEHVDLADLVDAPAGPPSFEPTAALRAELGAQIVEERPRE